MDKIEIFIICLSLVIAAVAVILAYHTDKYKANYKNKQFAQIYCITEQEATEIKKELYKKALEYHNNPKLYITVSSGIQFSPIDGSVISKIKSKVGGGLVLEAKPSIHRCRNCKDVQCKRRHYYLLSQ